MSKWYCVKSPAYGLLPFTCHTERRGALLRFLTHGFTLEEQARFYADEVLVKEAWAKDTKDGFRMVRINASEVKP